MTKVTVLTTKPRYMIFGKAHLLALLFLVVPFVSFAEYIESFDARIEISKDSSVAVREDITYVFTEPKHGIFRYVSTTHPQKSSAWFRERYLDITVENVTLDGASVPYEVSTESDQVVVKIGNPDLTITGKHVYSISYGVRGALSYVPETEFYWNVTGNDWPVPMQSVSATLIAPPGTFSSARACYKGMTSGTASCDSVSEDGGTRIFRSQYLKLGEEMTIAQGILPTSVTKVSLERSRMMILWVIGLVLWFFGLLWFVYQSKTAYRSGGTVIPQYEPYPDVKPMYAGLLMDGRLDPRDITACIVYLAEQGYLKIQKTEKKVLFFFEVDDYRLTIAKALDEHVSTFERHVLSLLFKGAPTLGSLLSFTQGVQPEEWNVGSTILLSELKKDMFAQRANVGRMRTLRIELENDLEERGFYQVFISTASASIVAFFGVIIAIISFVGSGNSVVSVGIIVTLLVSLLILLLARRRRTVKGYEALDHLSGFKEFLSVTDKERFDFHNAPEKSPEQFMQYLPYAIAFGVEEKWAETFKDITIPTPDWYEGGSVGTFSAVNLSTSLGAFSSAVAASSGSSGSSGGGSAGGGGGGGGGGSW